MTFQEIVYDDRAQDKSKPVAKYPLLTTHASVTTETEIVGTEKITFKGVLKQIKYNAPNLTTDTDFSIVITDQDGAIQTITGIPDNAPTTPKYRRIVQDIAPLICTGNKGWFTITISWITAQSLGADVFKIWGQIIDH